MQGKLRLKNILILLLTVVIILAALVACNGGDEGAGDGGSTSVSIDKAAVLTTLGGNLAGSYTAVDTARGQNGVVSVISEYSIDAEGLKYTVTYNASRNYGKIEDSEVYLKIYDDETHETRLMTYYTAGVLYYELDGARKKIEGFGTSGVFPLFMSTVSSFDLSDTVVNGDFPLQVPTLANLLKSNNINVYTVTDTRTNVSISNVNLDTSKAVPNGMIASAFGQFGTTFDALGMQFLGTALSDLAAMKIRTIDANLVEFYSDNGVFDEMKFDFSGKLETLSDFSLVGGFSIVPNAVVVPVSDWDNEATLSATIAEYGEKNKLSAAQISALREKYEYTEFSLGQGTYTGVMTVTATGASYDAVLDYDLNSSDNATNVLSLKLTDGGLPVAAAYYLDGRLYLDAGDLYDVFNAGLGLSYLNFPKASLVDFDIAALSSRVLDILDNLVRETDASATEDDRQAAWNLLLEKVKSDGTKLTLIIDKELIQALNQLSDTPLQADNVAAWIASVIGVDQSIIDNFLSSSAFDDMAVSVGFDVAQGELTFAVLFGSKTLLTLDLFPAEAEYDLYLPVSSAYSSVVADTVTLGGKTYDLTADGKVLDGAVEVGTYDIDSKRFSVGNVSYTFAASTLKSTLTGNEVVGKFDRQQRLVEFRDVVYRYDDANRLLSTDKRGYVKTTLDGTIVSLTEDGVTTSYSVYLNNLYLETDTAHVTIVGNLAGDTVTMTTGKVYYSQSGTLYENPGTVSFGGSTVTVSMTYAEATPTTYYAEAGTVSGIRGIYRINNVEVYVDGVTYYVHGDKVYQDLTYALELGSVVASDKTINVGATAYRYDNVEKAVSQHVFKKITAPTSLGMRMTGTVQVTNAESQDMSKLLGAFIGDSLGLNTPLTLYATDRLEFDISANMTDSANAVLYVNMFIRAKNGSITQLLKLYSATDDSDDVLIDYAYLGIKFRAPRAEIINALQAFAGEASVFSADEPLVAIFSALSLARTAYDQEGIRFALDYVAVTGQDLQDPMFTLFGVRNLSAEGLLVVDYELDMQEVETANGDTEYLTPELDDFKSIDTATSIYDAKWIDEIGFKNITGLTLKIPYDPATVTIETGKSVYVPRASLLGQVLTYTLVLTGGETATKVVTEVVGNEIIFDNYEKTPAHDTIYVRFDDGTYGYLPYEIDGFDFGLIKDSGLTSSAYDVVIGRGMIGETVLSSVAVGVKCRELAHDYQKYYQKTVLGSVTIDPYDFAATNDRSFLPSALTVRFLSASGSTVLRTEDFAFEWDFAFDQIDVGGGTLYARATRIYKDADATVYREPTDLVYEVVVTPKLVSYIRFGDEGAQSTYTVDVMDGSTYTVPTRSREGYRIAVYFGDGQYRIVGNEAMGFATDAYCDGYFDLTLDWLYDAADTFSVSGVSNPLGGGTVSTNTATLAIAGLSEQLITIEVKEPTRRVAAGGSVNGVIANTEVNGTIVRSTASFTYSNVNVGEGIGNPLTVNPYKLTALPDVVTIGVRLNSSSAEITYYTYSVESWVTDGNVIKETEDGYFVAYPASTETYFKAIAVIGDGARTQEVVVPIHNVDAVYAHYRFEGLQQDQNVIKVNAYTPYDLPDSFTLVLADGTEYPYTSSDFTWVVNYGTAERQTINPWSAADYTAYKDFVEGRSRIYDATWFTTYYQFANVDADVTLTAYVPTGLNGSLEQAVPLIARVVKLQDFAVDFDGLDTLPSGSVAVDQYSQASGQLVSALKDSEHGDISVVPLNMYSAAESAFYTYYQRVDWTSSTLLNNLLTALSSASSSSTHTLTGTVASGGAGEQNFTATFVLEERSVASSEDFYFTGLATVSADIMTVGYTYDSETGAKSLTINLLKPYALQLKTDGTFGYALPSQYFAVALAKTFISFSDGVSGTYNTDIDALIAAFATSHGKSFDAAVLDFGTTAAPTNSSVSFDVRTSQGSADDFISVTVNTTRDTIRFEGGPVYVELYNTDGSLAYTIENGNGNGYPISNVYKVNYLNSGEVNYTVQWTLEETTFTGMDTDFTHIKLSALNNGGGTCTLSATLPDGTAVVRTIVVYPKNLAETRYNSATVSVSGVVAPTVTATEGVITLDNVYQLYDIMRVLPDGRRVLDAAKVPNVLSPIRHSGTGTASGIGYNSDLLVNFTVSWAFDSGAGYYFYVGADGTLHGSAIDGVYKVGTAQIGGYGTETQTVWLYLSVTSKMVKSVSADGYDFRYADGVQYLYFDPYAVNSQGFYEWFVNLPTAISVQFSDDTSYTFNGGVSYKYGGASVESVELAYDRLVAIGATAIAAGTTQADVTIVLTDGYELSLRLVLIPRVFDSVSVPYITTNGTTAYLGGNYYIDPYTTATHTVPNTITVLFDGGSELNLNVAWTSYKMVGGVLTASDIDLGYAGGIYTLRTAIVGKVLSGADWIDSSNAQTIDITVTVLDRSLKTDFTATSSGLNVSVVGGILTIERHFADYIGARLADIFPHTYTASDFADLPVGCPADTRISYPELRFIAADGSDATDDLITNGMAAVSIDAKLGSAAVNGQSGKLSLTTDKLTIKPGAAGFSFDGGGSTVLYFNPYSKDSLVTDFTVNFTSQTFNGTEWVAGGDTAISFYTAFSAGNDATKGRHLIYWGSSMASKANGALDFVIGNQSKTERTSIKNIGTYYYKQVGAVRVDLGFGVQDGASVPYSFVVDPLSPEVPSTAVSAEGNIDGVWYDLGTIRVVWPTTVLQNIAISGETRTLVAVTLEHGVAGVNSIPVNYTVYYLDRTPQTVWTTDTGYSTLVNDGYYKLYDKNLPDFAGLTIDPIVGMYVTDGNYSGYRYVSNLRVELPTYNRTTDPMLYLGVQKYGSTVDITGLNYNSWGLNGRTITLEGTGASPISMSLLGGTVTRDGKSYQLGLVESTDVSVNPYLFKLNVKNRAITATGITKTSDIHVAYDGVGSETDYSIDPYNIYLPKSFNVTFGSGLESSQTTYGWSNSYSELWQFDDDSRAKLTNKTYISGAANVNEMYVIAYFMVNGEAFDVKFPILPRLIDVEEEGNRDVAVNGAIPGGTVYVLEGTSVADIESQLPDGIYYNFDYGAPVEKYSYVPLSYETVTFYKAGTYRLFAKLGVTSLDYNIFFDIHVIAPDLYDVHTTTDAIGSVTSYSLYDLVYDYLPVSVNSSGVMLAGLESDWVPSYLYIGDGSYLEIESIAYSMSEAKAILTCGYRFILETDGPRIAGDQNGNRYMSFQYEVPIVANRIDALVADAVLSASTLTVELGSVINISDFPSASYDGRDYRLYWDISGDRGGDTVDINVAGSYIVRGYLLNAFNVTKVYNLNLVVARRELLSTEFGFVNETEQLNRSYSGQRVDWNVSVPNNCINVYGEKYAPVATFAYSADNGISWTTNQPVAVGTYLIKIIVDDQNVHGEKVLSLTINKAIIDSHDISFSATTVPYNGRAQQPIVSGVPSGVDYYFTFTRVEGSSIINYEYAINASGDHPYRATLVFAASDSYTYNGSNLTIDFTITKADPNYVAVASETYNGNYRHIYVEGLPTVMTNGLQISYIYTNSALVTTTGMIRNVGTYTYEINIIGGQNYEDNTLSGTYTITPATLTVDVGHIEVTYLDDMKTLDDQLVITGVVGTDAASLLEDVFGELILTSSVSLDGYSKPGNYTLTANGLANPNYIVVYVDDNTDGDAEGRYSVVLPEGTVDISTLAQPSESNAQALTRLIVAATADTELKLYLPAGEYTAQVLDSVGASLTLIGEYDAAGNKVTIMDGLDVVNGSVILRALSFKSIEETVSVMLRRSAGSLSMDRVDFAASGTGSVAVNSVGVYSEYGYNSDISAYKVTVSERFTGFYIRTGTLTVENSSIVGCVAGIVTTGSRLVLIDSVLSHATQYALYLMGAATAVEINGNTFRYNVVAIKYNIALALSSNSEVLNENEYFKNTANLLAQQ